MTPADKLRAEISKLEAKLESKRAELAAMETGKPQKTGLDLLWEAALPKSRNRSSKQACRLEWNKIPKSQQPTLSEMISALKAWNATEEWTVEASAFAPGLHRFIKNRLWESLPEAPRQSAGRSWPKPAPAPVSEEPPATPEEIAAIFDQLKRS